MVSSLYKILILTEYVMPMKFLDVQMLQHVIMTL